jgi:hypothetical protein
VIKGAFVLITLAGLAAIWEAISSAQRRSKRNREQSSLAFWVQRQGRSGYFDGETVH